MKEKTLHSLVLCLATIAVLLLTGCNTDLTDLESTTSVGQAQVTTTSSLRTENEAMTTALAMRQSFGGITRGSATCEIGDVYAWRSCDILPNQSVTRGNSTSLSLPDTLLYIVNFKDNNGYALVAADKRSGEDVVAITEKGHLTPEDNISHAGLNIFLSQLPKILIPLPDSLIIIDHDSIHDNTGTPYPIYTVVEEVLPLLETEWNSHVSPFNDLCPLINGEHADAGSAAIAMAQLCTYNKGFYPFDLFNHNWNTLTDNPNCPTTESGRQEVAEMVASIAYGILTEFHPDYSTASFSNVKEHFYNLYYGYAEDSQNQGIDYDSYSFDLCKRSLNFLQPIYIEGYSSQKERRHSWVIDGYRITKRPLYHKTADEGPETTFVYRNYIHCNWGEGGEGNGYFLSTAYEPNVEFNEDIQILYGLYYHSIPLNI